MIDAIEAITPVEYAGTVWRIAREGRNPLQCSRSGGRWDDGTFDVLYTSEMRVGAINEMKFHLMRGQPVIPSLVQYKIYELEIGLSRSLKLLNMAALEALGMDVARFGQLSYQEKDAEYPRSQDIGEVAHFLDYDGLVVPSARFNCLNVVVFCDQVPPESISMTADHGAVNWD
ncbi:MAG: RES family NAD+ phosphorylase [Rhizobiaceae bacterium]